MENIYVKLPQSHESEDIVKTLLSDGNIKEENKLKIISNTKFTVADLGSVNKIYYVQLLNENKVFPVWKNIVTAYSELGVDESLLKFIEINSGNIQGNFSEISDPVRSKLFKDLIASALDETIMNELAKCIDIRFAMNEFFGKCNGVGPFILAGCFEFNVADMRFLQNPPSTLPYLIKYQNKIKSDMKSFFGSITFKSQTVKNIIDETKIGLKFKQEFVSLHGENFDITGIEDVVANFIVRNNCEICEKLLYKFTDTSINASLKIALLTLTIKTKGIKNLNEYRLYFCAIDKDYADFWKKTKKLSIENTMQNRLIVDFMKMQELIISCTTRKDKIHISCA